MDDFDDIMTPEIEPDPEPVGNRRCIITDSADLPDGRTKNMAAILAAAGGDIDAV